jgi:hypothetical protein
LKNETFGSPIAYFFKDPSSHSISSIGDLNVEPGEETGCLIPYYQEERGIEKFFFKKNLKNISILPKTYKNIRYSK